MESRRAINALEPFVLLTKSATSPRGAADLILQAISSPNTYVFAELLQAPNIQALRQTEYASHLTLLEIFSYGTFADYKASSASLLELSPAQTQKLQQLTLLSLARDQSPLPYATLQAALSLPDVTSLESLVGTAHAASLLTGTLDPQAQVLYIDSIAPLRDLSPGSLPQLTHEVHAWSARCSDVLGQLEAQARQIRETASVRAHRQGIVSDALEQKIAAEAAGGGLEQERVGAGRSGKRVLEDKEGLGGKHEQDAMDIDEEQSVKTRGAKRTLTGSGRPAGS